MSLPVTDTHEHTCPLCSMTRSCLVRQHASAPMTAAICTRCVMFPPADKADVMAELETAAAAWRADRAREIDADTLADRIADANN